MNLLHGCWCPSVVCVPAPKVGQPDAGIFRLADGRTVDELPPAVAAALPGPEWERCESHRLRRLGSRRAA